MPTKIGQLASEMSRTNPWWRDSTSWWATDLDLQSAARTGLAYRADALANLTPGGLHLLRGPRRVGKTVTVKQTIQDLLNAGTPPTSIVRMAVDGWEAADLRTMVQNTALPPMPAGHTRWWFLDEVTSVAGDWARQIKWLRDNDPEFSAATVVLTGSSVAQLTAASGVLAGRRQAVAANSNRTLMPMGFATFARLLDPSLPTFAPVSLADLRSTATDALYQSLSAWLHPLAPLWERYLQYGGFPTAVAAVRAGQSISPQFIDDLFDVVFRDAFADSQLTPSKTNALYSRIMEGMASPLNMQNVAEDVGLARETVRRHVSYLEDSYLVWRCPQREESSWTARERAQDKVYAVDPVLARLSFLRNSAHTDVDPTILAEMQLGMAVHRAAYAAGRQWEDDEFLFYIRTATRKEIDFVSELFAGVALEGKFIDGGSWRGEAATVNASEWEGILATRTVLDTSVPDAWAVPAAFVAFLIDS